MAGQTLQGYDEIGNLLVTTRDGRPVYVRDLASISLATSPAENRVSSLVRSGDGFVPLPAVSIAVAKRAGSNAVVIADRIVQNLAQMKGGVVPDDVDVTVTRNYGESANEKANELLFHLALATISIVLLVAIAIGWREAIVVAVVIPTTILLTLFAARVMGYTLNRVSLFALIFSIGILVDDAIVVIENIARHWAMNDGRSRTQAAIEAVGEVGNPTIVATLTVVAALLPMLFVSGMMGPYMSPIPANASAAMIFSFFVAVILTPWLMLKVAGRIVVPTGAHGHGHGEVGALGRLYLRVAGPILATRTRSWIFLTLVGLATIGSLALFATKDVTVKLLPFDNKPELQVVVDLPEGSSVEDTNRTLQEIAARIAAVPEIVSFQTYAGAAAPFNFNGLVRHYALRTTPELGDVQVNLTPKAERERASHAIALDIRQRLADLPTLKGTVVKVVEPPPGPPVLATLLAEIYGPDPETRRATAAKVREAFASVPFVVDVDDSFGQQMPRVRVRLEQDNVEFNGVEQRDVYDTLRTLQGGTTVGYSHRGGGRQPIPIRLELSEGEPRGRRAHAVHARSRRTPCRATAALSSSATSSASRRSRRPFPIFRHNGRPAEMVTAELAGAFEAPIYGMLAVGEAIDKSDWGDLAKPAIALHGQPLDESRADAAVGRRVGGHLGHVPRHGRRVLDRARSASTSSSSRSSARSSCRW